MIFPEWLKIYGEKDYRNKKCPVEDAELVTFINQLKKMYPDSFGRLVLHVPNEGKRRAHEVNNLKKKGALNKGASDIIIPGNPSLVIEMKRRDHTLSEWEDGQLEYLEASKKAKCFVCVCLGWEAAMMAFNDWRATHYPLKKPHDKSIQIDSF